MALPACFHLAETVFPAVRQAAAHRLSGDGLRQGEIAARLGVSQAMVSKYLKQETSADPLVHRLADELVSESDADWCPVLANADDEALHDLLAAERRLLDASPLAIMPQIGINIARAVPGAQSPGEVLAYPARIIADGQRFLRPAPPRHGASNHLASCLLAWQQHDPTLTAIANIRGGQAIRALRPGIPEISGEGDRPTMIARTKATTLIHDAGAVGMEPCLYIAGRSATEVIDQILSIAKELS